MKIKPPRVHTGFAGSRAELLQCSRPCWGGSWNEASVWSSKHAECALEGHCLGQKEEHTFSPWVGGLCATPFLHGQHRWLLYPLPLNLCWRLEGAQEKGPANLESKFWLSSDERAILRQTASFLGVAGLSCELRCTLFSALHFLTPLTLSSLTFPTRFR